MRGIRQLGLAHLVFPSAMYGRLEHMIGAIGAADAILNALTRQIDRWNRDNKDRLLPAIGQSERQTVRLAALFHDVGHGPFSHALEPVLDIHSPLRSDDGEKGWRKDLRDVQTLLMERYTLNKAPSISEVLSVMLVVSEGLTEVLRSDNLFTERGTTARAVQESIVAAIVGAVEGPGATYLSAVISSQVDADRMDFLARDSYHAGLEISFDTSRLLSRLEVLRITKEWVEDPDIQNRVKQQPNGVLHQLGIAASGFGSFEQMLIGRTFLYDRLYHHHKVRAAEAMAQRLMLIAERDRAQRFTLAELFLPVSDDTMLQIFAGRVTHPTLATPCEAAKALAQGILDRELFHRAFAFRGHFIASPPALGSEKAEQNQKRLWGRLAKALDTLRERYRIGKRIYELAAQCGRVLADLPDYSDAAAAIGEITADQVIIDLPDLKTEGIRTLARYPNGMLRVPDFSFNPQKWADAYDLQKRTSYVFCPQAVVPLVSLASKIVFLEEFGVAMARDADGFIKAGKFVKDEVWKSLQDAGIIDEQICGLLTNRRHALITIRADELGVPAAWILEDADFDSKLAVALNRNISSGLTHEHLEALKIVLQAMFSFVDVWFSSQRPTKELEDEQALQNLLRDHLRARELRVTEGSVLGGGILDLSVEDAILIENKFHGSSSNPAGVKKAAGMQGRRYAISLGSQAVIVVTAYRPPPGKFPRKVDVVDVQRIAEGDNRAEIRFSMPYGAVRPSDEVAESK
jgi:HD superfamily phosphohydrolase